MYYKVEELILKKKSDIQFKRGGIFWPGLLTGILFLAIGVFGFVVDRHPNMMFYKCYLVFCVGELLFIIFYIFGYNEIPTEKEIQKKAESLLEEFESFEQGDYKCYKLFEEIPVKSKEDVRQAILDLQEMLEIKQPE